jgi:hypothetical protein
MPLSPEHALDGVNEEEAICGGLVKKVPLDDKHLRPCLCISIRVGLVSPLTCHISEAVLNYFYILAVPLNLFGQTSRFPIRI